MNGLLGVDIRHSSPGGTPISEQLYSRIHLPDSIRARYIAERVVKHVELYRLLVRRRHEWLTKNDVAEELGCSTRHARRLLEAFAAAGYVELRRGTRTRATPQAMTRVRIKPAAL